MVNLVVIGGQWGDEGKGKVVDLLCPAFRHVVRFNGGNNAGHTVRFGDRHFALHLVPSGILHAETRCAIGPGVVIDPTGLAGELAMLEAEGVDPRGRLSISPRAHLVLPGHRALDRAREAARGAARIGTTGRGIGPTYESRAARFGVRVGVVRDPDRFRKTVAEANARLFAMARALDPDCEESAKELAEAIDHALEMAPMVADVSRILRDAVAGDEPIMFEGAQGTMLDIDHGTYPFVTSSGCLAGYAAPACGLPARTIGGVLAVIKAYTSRVGSGPFPTELLDATGEFLRTRGNEFGTTTGRPRRTGWLDAVAVRAAVAWNGIDAIALTKLDVLDELAEVSVATAYRIGGVTTTEVPDDVVDLERVEPVYETLPGWQADTSGVTTFEGLPANAQAYVRRIEELTGAPVALISTGPRREETIGRAVAPFGGWFPGGLSL